MSPARRFIIKHDDDTGRCNGAHMRTKRVRCHPPAWQVAVALLTACAAMGGCASLDERDLAAGVVTALPADVTADCTFLGNVDTGARSTIGAARLSLRLQTARLDGNLLVETHAYALPRLRHDVGVALSGRAYRCAPDHHLLQSSTVSPRPRTLGPRTDGKSGNTEGAHNILPP